MKVQKKMVMLLVLLLIGLSFVYAAGQEETVGGESKISFNFGHVMPIEHPEHKAAQKMQELIANSSKGRISMNVFPSTQLGGDREMMTSLMNNTLEMACVATFGSIESKISVVEMPYLFEDYEHIMEFIKSDVQKELLVLLESHGVKGLGYYPAGARHIGNDVKPVKNPSDLKNLLIRVYEHALLKDTLTALGAKLTVTPYSEVYMALATNQIDGEENPFVNTYAMKFHEQQKYKTETHHMDQFKIVGTSKKWWDGLTSSDQELIQNAFYEAYTNYYIGLMENSNEEYKKLLEAEGVEITEIADYSPWRIAVEPVYEKWSKIFGPDLIRQIEELAK
jgi:tripartite ATP-independent transporter DctP family solute receptor